MKCKFWLAFVAFLSINSAEILKENDPLLSADLFEGDISGVDSQTLSNVVNGSVFWPDKSIPYLIDNSVGYIARRAIAKAIAEFESKTCIRFRNATEIDADLVLFIVSKGCSSYIGKQGGKQEVSIGEGCEQIGVVLHLLMHVLGFWHEQSRLDRDLYILINWDNIATENAKYFEKYTIPRINIQSASDPSLSPYDYDSITHISPYSYAKDKSTPTILTKDERFRVGQRLELSQNDVNAIVRAYCGQKQAGPSNDVLTVQEKIVYEKTVVQQTGDANKQQDGQSDEDAPLIEPDQPEGCRDTSRKCPHWATQGLCYKNSIVMADKCAGSCQACQMIGICDNFNSLCGIWAWLGLCVGTSAQKYLAACPLSCGVCVPEGTENQTEPPPEITTIASTDTSKSIHGSTVSTIVKTTVRTTTKSLIICDDKNKDCAKWSSKGRCFYKHVQKLCPRSCNLTCDQPPSTPGAKVTKMTKAPVTRTTPICKDKRKNCDRFVPKGYCERPLFKKACLLSCNLCGGENRFDDKPLDNDIDENSCHDHSHAVCEKVHEYQRNEICNFHAYIRRLCPRKCGLHCDPDMLRYSDQYRGNEI